MFSVSGKSTVFYFFAVFFHWSFKRFVISTPFSPNASPPFELSQCSTRADVENHHVSAGSWNCAKCQT